MTTGTLHIEKFRISTETKTLKYSGNIVVYNFDVSFSLIGGNKKECDIVANELRSGAFLVYLGNKIMAKEEEISVEENFKAEFILYQLGQVMRLIDKEKTNEAVTLFKLIEELMPEYRIIERANEVDNMRNVVWDMLAKRKLI